MIRWLLPALLSLVLCGIGVVFERPSLLGRSTPYSEMTWESGAPYVKVDGVWWRLLAIDDRPVRDVAAVARRLFNTEWRRGFVSAFPTLMKASGRRVFRSATLTLAPRDAPDRTFRRTVPLTVPNRRAAELAEARRRDDRTHATTIPGDWVRLTRRVDGYEPASDAADWLAADQARLDLDVLEYRLRRRYAYLKRTAYDYRTAFDALRAALGAGITRRDLGIQLEMLLAGFGDGHTGVSLATGLARLPFVLRAIDGHVAWVDCHDRAIDPDAPLLESIDGTPVATLLSSAGELVPRGTTQLARERALRSVAREYGLVRALLGHRAPGGRLQLGVRGPRGVVRRTIELPITAVAGPDASCARSNRAGILEGNVGLLVVPSMDSGTAFRQWLDRAMGWFGHTNGLVVDVRGNSGGGRQPVFALLRYFLSAPTVVNVAALRIDRDEDPELDESYGLEDRFLHPAAASVFGEAERAAIRRFSSSFRPDWSLPDGEFSKWHYAVAGGDRRRSYRRPVAVLIDGRTFSAAELFASAMKGLPNVTLVGTPSAGGSGTPVSLILPYSGLEIRYSTMASFQPDGRLFDGRGVRPDVPIEPRLADLAARRDTQLEAALRIVRQDRRTVAP